MNSMAAATAAHPGVAACARSLTHLRLRSLTCSSAPWAAFAEAVGRQFI
jgi:hypothetical protein